MDCGISGGPVWLRALWRLAFAQSTRGFLQTSPDGV
jgi:hypothetical protein